LPDLFREIQSNLGIRSLWGVAQALPDREAERRYRAWLALSLHADMPCLTKSADIKFAPEHFLAGVKTIIMCALPLPVVDSAPPVPHAGLVALYARGRDYHRAVGALLRRIIQALRERYPETLFRPFCDTLPLSERVYAARAGLGQPVRSGLLANSRYGTRFVLGGILTTLDIADSPMIFPAGDAHFLPQSVPPKQCAHCRICVDACPGKALGTAPDGSCMLDVSRCLAWQSIENKDVIPVESWPLFGDRIFGCDICQDVCPYNAPQPGHSLRDAKSALFDSAHAAGAYLPLADILAIRDEAAFARRFSGTALMRARRRGLVRNAIIAAINGKHIFLLPRIAELRMDPDPVIAETARLAAL
jgi:epoxyqueuosine reductase